MPSSGEKSDEEFEILKEEAKEKESVKKGKKEVKRTPKVSLGLRLCLSLSHKGSRTNRY